MKTSHLPLEWNIAITSSQTGQLPQTLNSSFHFPLSPNIPVVIAIMHLQAVVRNPDKCYKACLAHLWVVKAVEVPTVVILGLDWGYNIRILENKMETTIWGKSLRASYYWGSTSDILGNVRKSMGTLRFSGLCQQLAGRTGRKPS